MCEIIFLNEIYFDIFLKGERVHTIKSKIPIYIDNLYLYYNILFSISLGGRHLRPSWIHP